MFSWRTEESHCEHIHFSDITFIMPTVSKLLGKLQAAVLWRRALLTDTAVQRELGEINKEQMLKSEEISQQINALRNCTV